MIKMIWPLWSILLPGFVLLTSIFSCKNENVDTKETDLFLVRYSRQSSWVGYSYTATADQNGYLQITEQLELIGENRNAKYPLAEHDLLRIKEKLNDLVSIDISDRYGFDNENAPTDLPVISLMYETPAKSDSTQIYFPRENELPDELASFIQTFDQMLVNYDTMINH